MPVYFFDTSAVAEHYHAETGTAEVDARLAAPGAVAYVSRLSVVEFHSVFAKRVRTGALPAAAFATLTGRFRKDVVAKRLLVVRLLVAHFQTAERLIRRIGPGQNLRTLDALQSRSLFA